MVARFPEKAALYVAAVDGSVGIPSIGFGDDWDTGLYRVGQNQLGIATGGVRRALVSTTGWTFDLPLAFTGALTITDTTASALTVGRQGAAAPVLKVDASATTVATGLSITGAAAASGVALAAISSGTDENLKMDAKGSGTITLGSVSTGNLVWGRSATGVSLAVTGLITSSSPSAGIGYATGAGGTATQTINRSTTAVMSPASCLSGKVTTDTTSLAAEVSAEFQVTNGAVAVGDVVVASIRSGANGGNTDVTVSTVAAGSFKLRVSNNNASGGTAETGALVINFAVIKAVEA
ncbi:MAG: hypothetical protein NTZ05_04160 [Chloroflexi bacterium]|nr:hypothetical protein [Chloroflexota bacterium]